TRLADIDPLQVIREAFSLIYRMNLRLPARFVLLDKAIATLGSVGVALYPDFNVFEVARPYARDLILDRFAPTRIVTRVAKDARSLARVITEAPFQVSDVLEELRDGEIEVGFRHKGLDDLSHRFDLVFNRLAMAVIVAAGLIGSALVGGLVDDGPKVLGLHVLAFVGFGLSALVGFWLVRGVVRSGRL
ncbi:MAG: hypothetical protein L0206_22725, partial [Actinobacteria bacterium]|nr:hypothetical protein [Actinomycetota bacterium]